MKNQALNSYYIEPKAQRILRGSELSKNIDEKKNSLINENERRIMIEREIPH